MKNSKNEKFYIQALHRAFKIVDILALSESGLTLTEISEEIDLPVSTLYRILQNLMEWQYVKEDINGVYTLGLQLITLGNKANKNIGVRSVAKKYMEELSNITKETIYLSILDEKSGSIIYIDKIESKSNIKLGAGIGSRNYIHSTANGRVLVSQFDKDRILGLLNIRGIIKITDNTMTDTAEILKAVKETRSNGYSIDDLENEPEVRCIAAPIFDYRKKVVASLSISGISSHVTREKIDDNYLDLLLNSTKKISTELGYR
jgi:DNA-binding IclR family transcriptional regulator